MKKILLISLALVLALGTLGVAGALWSDWLYIDGYVQTGYIGAEWTLGDYWDNEAADKDVSSIVADIDGDTLWIDIYNAYPSITYTVQFDLHGTGSVPIHFDWPLITTDLPAGTDFTFTLYDAAGNVIFWPDVQLHQFDAVWGTLTIHLDNDASQDYWYFYQIELQYGQYNEFP